MLWEIYLGLQWALGVGLIVVEAFLPVGVPVIDMTVGVSVGFEEGFKDGACVVITTNVVNLISVPVSLSVFTPDRIVSLAKLRSFAISISVTFFMV